jgi:hypothetical protein
MMTVSGQWELPIALVQSSDDDFVAILRSCYSLHVSRNMPWGAIYVKDSATIPTDVEHESYNIVGSRTSLVASTEWYPLLSGHITCAMLLANARASRANRSRLFVDK